MAPRQTQDGPSTDEVTTVLESLTDGDPTMVPNAGELQTLERAGISAPLSIDGINIRDWSVTEGNPRNGALRSDDHVSLWEVEYWERHGCEECGSHRRLYRYQAHHHIAGSEATFCKECETKLDGEDWG